MAISYTTLGSTVTITDSGIIPASQLNNNVAIVGGYNASNAAAGVTEGEATVVNTSTAADEQFGADSELARQAAASFANGSGAVYGVPLPETQTTETVGSSTATASGTLSADAIHDPRFNPEEEVTFEDVTEGTSLTVNLVYGTPASPSDANTVNLNPRTLEWEADEASEYDITYTETSYADAISAAISEDVRTVVLCLENASAKAELLAQLTTAEQNFNFMRAVVGAEPDIQSADISGYTPAEEDWRIVEVAPAHATDGVGDLRSAGAVGGLLASQPIDVTGSITYDDVGYLTGFNVEYSPTEADSFEQVTAIIDTSQVAEGVTTSSETGFRDIYKVEIIDLIVEQVQSLVEDFSGGSNSQNARRLFASRIRRALSSYSAPNATPPLLASGDGSRPYYVEQSLGASDTEANVTIAIDVAPIAKSVNLDFTTGPIQFAGANTTQ